MTPAEYARSRGWRVGDLVLGIGTAAQDTWAIVGILAIEGDCVFGYTQNWLRPRCYVYDVTGYKRIGRVLRPDGR